MNAPCGSVGWAGGLCLALAGAAWAGPPEAAARSDLYGAPLPPEAVARLGPAFLPDGGAQALAYSPDGKVLASGGSDSVILWEAAAGKRLRKLAASNGRVVSLAFSPDGKSLAVLSDTSSDKESKTRIEVWDPSTAKNLQTLEFAGTTARSVAFAADGKTLVYLAVVGKTVQVCEADGGKVLRELTGHSDRVLFAAFSEDGKTVASASLDKTFRRWDAATGKELGQAALPESAVSETHGVNSLAFSPDGRTMALDVIGLHLYDAVKGKELFTAPLGQAYALAFSPDGKTLAAGCGGFPIRLWDPATGKEIGPLEGHRSFIGAVALSPDGKFAATAGQDFGGDRIVRIWDVGTAREIDRNERQIGVRSLAFSPDGKTVAWGGPGFDSGIRLCPTSPVGVIRQLPKDKVEVTCVAFSPDGKTLAAGTGGKNIQLWDPKEGKIVREFEAHPGRIDFLAYSPDGKILASSGSQDKVRLWDVGTGKEVLHFSADRGWGGFGVCSLAFSPDGKMLATTTGGEEFIRLWDVAAGKEVRRINTWDEVLFIDRRTSGPVIFSSDGRTVISADDYTGVISLYETATGDRRHHLKGHSAGVVQIALSADGRLLISGGFDCAALLWDLSGPAPAESWDVPLDKPDALWDELAAPNAGRAYHAVRTLAAGGKRTTALLEKKLPPVSAADPKRLANLIGDLNSDDLPVREAASAELAKLGESAAGGLRNALDAGPPAETRRRAEELLEKLSGELLPPERLRHIRAVEVLESMNTTDARELLEALSKGAPEARLTREAKNSLARLARRPVAP